VHPTKAIFFDRDGVINRRIKGGYVRSWSEFELLPEVGSVVAEVRRRGYKAIIITNQRGVGTGHMTETDLQRIHDELQRLLAEVHEAQFDDILYCTDRSDDSPRRKPSPAMLLEAAERWNIDLSESWMVGDSASDVEAGKRAGTHTAYLVTEFTDRIPADTQVLHSLTELLKFV
jgi:D-glycero-D-manno-heptose 1,7-bisphosphate phosphatase